MISQNDHQEEDQEGIRLRDNNVVHFVSDGFTATATTAAAKEQMMMEMGSLKK